jgi:hypothetical protein
VGLDIWAITATALYYADKSLVEQLLHGGASGMIKEEVLVNQSARLYDRLVDLTAKRTAACMKWIRSQL